MSFIAGSIIIGGALAAGGAVYSSKQMKKASDTASAGALTEVELNRESRDLARADQAPYQKAGVTALNALMSMTGLGGGGGGGGNVSSLTRTEQALAQPGLTPEQRAWHTQYPDTSTIGESSTQGERYNIPDDVNAGDFMRERYRSGLAAGVNFGTPVSENNPFQGGAGGGSGGGRRTR